MTLPDKLTSTMRGFNIWTAVITGVPLAALVAYGEANPTGEGNWFILCLTATLSAFLLGVPQGFLAAVHALHRGRWHRAALLVAMVIAGIVLTRVSSFIVIGLLPSIVAPGRWEPLPSPPVNITTLAGPTCYDRYPVHDHGLCGH